VVICFVDIGGIIDYHYYMTPIYIFVR